MKKNLKHGRDISTEELKQIQQNILDEVDLFCRENNIKYFLMFGTLLGAVRHKGYIPWDDDIDIAMLRADYDRFIATFRSRNNDMEIECYEKNHSCVYPFAKVYNTNTVFYDTNEKNALGVNIDVFPIDNVPAEKDKIYRLTKKARILRRINILKYLQFDSKRGVVKNLVIAVGRALRIIPNRVLAKKMNSYQRSEKNETGFVAMLTGGGSSTPVFYQSLTFETCVEMEFEGKQYLGPIGYHTVLYEEFGNYMELPPVEKRISHHSFCAYWK